MTTVLIYYNTKIMSSLATTLLLFNLRCQVLLMHSYNSGMVGLAPKWVRLNPKLDKSGTLSDNISVHLYHRVKCTEI